MIEIPGPGGGAIAVATFVATEVDDSGAAVCPHLEGAPVVSGESVSGGSIDDKQGLTLVLQDGEEQKSLEAWCFDSGSSISMSNSCKKITNFRPRNTFVRPFGGKPVLHVRY